MNSAMGHDLVQHPLYDNTCNPVWDTPHTDNGTGNVNKITGGSIVSIIPRSRWQHGSISCCSVVLQHWNTMQINWSTIRSRALHCSGLDWTGLDWWELHCPDWATETFDTISLLLPSPPHLSSSLLISPLVSSHLPWRLPAQHTVWRVMHTLWWRTDWTYDEQWTNQSDQQ